MCYRFFFLLLFIIFSSYTLALCSTLILNITPTKHDQIYMKMFPLRSQSLSIHQYNKCLLRKDTATATAAAVVATIIRRVTKFTKYENCSVITKNTDTNATNSGVSSVSLNRYFPQGKQQTPFAYPLTTFVSSNRAITTTMSNKSDDINVRNYYNVALELVMKCGPLVREGYNKTNADYKQKSEFFDLVTKYDKQIEDILIEGLQNAFPESKFIGEEAAAESGKVPELTDAPTWIIDPIDGTTNFIHRIPHWCISVGLAINKELVVGIVYNPIANEMYSASKGNGAYLNGQPIHVKKCNKMNDAVLAYEISLIHAPAVRDKNVKRLSKLAANSTGTRCIGSGALTLCYVARGSFDCYHVEDLQAWDIAGGAVILREAGGVLYHTKGGEFEIMKPNLIAAATPELAKIMVGLIEEADALTDFTFK